MTSIDNANTELFSVYPNPSKGKFSIASESVLEKIDITDINGTSIYSKVLNSKNAVVELDNLNTGLYFAKIQMNNLSKVEKIVIQ